MSRLTSVFHQPNARKDHYSMDIKDMRRISTYFSPFAKKRIDSQILKRQKTPTNQNYSIHNSRK